MSFYRHSVVTLALDRFVSDISLVLYRKNTLHIRPRLSPKIWETLPQSWIDELTERTLKLSANGLLFSENINLFNPIVGT